MDFQRQEYEARLRKCQSEMKAAGIDVLLVSSGFNIRYFSGYITSLLRDSNFRLFTMAIFQTDEPVLVVPNLEIGAAKRLAWFDDVRYWGGTGGFCDESTEALPKLLAEKNLLKCTIGAELDIGLRMYMTRREFDIMKTALPECRFVNGTQIIWKLRMVKSHAELACMREASRLTLAGYHYMLERVHAGMTEKDVHKLVEIGMLQEGCEQDNFVVVTAGDMRYSSMNPWPTDYEIKKGDLILVDWGGTYHGYWSDLTRVFAIGSISDYQRSLYDATNAMREIATKAARPGVPVGEIDIAATEFAKEQGLLDLMLHRSGHAIGLQIHEIPSIDASDTTIMQPGMCLTIEPAFYDFSKTGPSKGAFRIEDLVAITEEGNEVYSPSGKELVII